MKNTAGLLKKISIKLYLRAAVFCGGRPLAETGYKIFGKRLTLPWGQGVEYSYKK